MPLHEAPALPDGRRLHLPGRGTTFVRQVSGPPGAPTVVLLHGWLVSADLNWFSSYAPLAEHYNVVAIDHRGHGQGIRSRRRFRLIDCADDAVAVADALGIDRFVPIGYSMGGPIAMHVWRRHPHRVAGLVLCATSARFALTSADRAQFAAMRPLARGVAVSNRRVRQRVFSRLVEWQTAGRNYGDWAIEQVTSCDPRHILEAGTELGRFDATRWIDDVDVPTAAVTLRSDTVVPPERQRSLAASIPAIHEVLIDADHDVCVTRPQVWLPPFLDAVTSVTASV